MSTTDPNAKQYVEELLVQFEVLKKHLDDRFKQLAESLSVQLSQNEDIPNFDSLPEQLTVPQAAKFLKLSEYTVRLRCRDFEYPAIKQERTGVWLIDRQDLIEIFKERQENQHLKDKSKDDQ